MTSDASTGPRLAAAAADVSLHAADMYRAVAIAALDAGRTLASQRSNCPGVSEYGLARGLAGMAVLEHVVTADPPSLGAVGAYIRTGAASAMIRAVQATSRIDASLWSGHAGALWSAIYCDSALASSALTAATELGTGLAEASASSARHFDLIFGTAGLLVLGSLAYRRAGDRTLADSASASLLATRRLDGAWHTPIGCRPTPPSVAADHYVDWGVAHGQPGATAGLARFHTASSQPERAHRELRALWATANDLTGLESWPADGQTPLLPIFSGPDGIEVGSSDRWCYGDAGAAAVLVLASPDLTVDSPRINIWLDAAAASLQRGACKVDRLEPGLCHGTAGLIVIACRLFRATGQSRFADVALKLIDQASVHGIFDPARIQTVYGDGLLRGTAGVALALHAAVFDRPSDWDSVLGLS